MSGSRESTMNADLFNLNRRDLFELGTGVVTAGVFGLTPSAVAQTAGNAPSRIETRIGTLEFTHDFANGYPTDATIDKLYDERDFQRACQAYLWSLPAVAFTTWQRGTNEQLGAKNGQVVAILSYEARRGILTANATTPYYLGFADLSAGPLVVEMPARGVQGAINDAWQNGIPGTEKPGKYLVLAPGHKQPANVAEAAGSLTEQVRVNLEAESRDVRSPDPAAQRRANRRGSRARPATILPAAAAIPPRIRRETASRSAPAPMT